MFINRTLNKHLKEIQKIAQERIDIMIEKFKKQNNLTEEIVLNELIFVWEITGRSKQSNV